MPSPMPAPPPYASPTLSGVVSTGVQAFGGAKTFESAVVVSSGVEFGDGTVQVTAYTGGTGVTFEAPTDDPRLAPGHLVLVDSAGKAVIADATVEGKYPAMAVCTEVADGVATLLSVGPVTLFEALTPGTLYFLGEDGEMVTSPPEEARVAQQALRAITPTSGLLMLTSQVIYL